MDDVYAMELLRQSLIDACEREDRLILEFQTAQKEMEEMRRLAFVDRVRFQEIDEALEIEESKTNAERLARHEAEAKTRQYCLEISKTKQREHIANEHCDAAESEVLRLQRDLSKERAATVAMDRASSQLRDGLDLAKLNEMVASEQLIVAKAKLCELQKELRLATYRANMLERQGRELEESFEKEHRRTEETETALRAVTCESESNRLKLSEALEKYHHLAAKHNECDSPEFVTVPASKTGSMEVDKQYHAGAESRDQRNATGEQILRIDRGTEQKMVATDLPAFPEPAILRPALALVTACHPENLKATGEILPTSRANLRNILWSYVGRLHLLVRIISRRERFQHWINESDELCTVV